MCKNPPGGDGLTVVWAKEKKQIQTKKYCKQIYNNDEQISAANRQKHFISGTVNTTARRLEAETWSLKFPFWWNSIDEKLLTISVVFQQQNVTFFKKKIPPGQKTNKQKTTRQLKVKRSGISLKMIEGGVKLKSTRRQTRRICRRRLGSNISQKKKNFRKETCCILDCQRGRRERGRKGRG